VPVLLPAELSDVVIDQFSHDWSMLKVCSTICRRWLPRSRFHLFQDLAVDTSNSNHILRLLPIISSPLATIPLYVKSITIYYNEASMAQDLWADELDDLPYPLHTFPFATRLTLYIGSWGLQGERIRWLLESCKLNISVTQLCIQHSCFESFPGLARVISQCPSLQQLSLNGVQYSLFIFEMSSIVSVKDYVHMRGLVALPPDGYFRPPLGLHTLQLDNFRCSHFLDWLISLEPALPLHTVRINGIDWHEVPAVIDFIQHFAMSLDHLELQVDLPYIPSDAKATFKPYELSGTPIHSVHFDDHGKFIWDNNGS
jgi:hypothetical protein